MIRTLISLLAALLYLVVTLPVLLVLELFFRKDLDTQIRVARPMIRFIFRVFLFFSGIRLTVLGKERIPVDRPVLFIANHRSIFDVIATYPQLDRPTCYVAKESMKKVPLFFNWFSFIGSLYFDRNNLRDGIQMLKDAIGRIEDGKSVFIFPEGTRNTNETDIPLLPFHEGSFRIATKTGCPIVPVAISNMAALFEKQFPRLVPRQVTIEFGAPIDPTQLSRSEQKHLGEQVRSLLTEMLTAQSPQTPQ